MSDCSDGSSVAIKKNGVNSPSYVALKQKQLVASSNPDSMSNINLVPQERLLSLCSGVEPAVTCMDPR